MHKAQCILFDEKNGSDWLRGSLFLVSCPLFLVPCSLFLVPCSLFLVSCPLYLITTSTQAPVHASSRASSGEIIKRPVWIAG